MTLPIVKPKNQQYLKLGVLSALALITAFTTASTYREFFIKGFLLIALISTGVLLNKPDQDSLAKIDDIHHLRGALLSSEPFSFFRYIFQVVLVGTLLSFK